jgi:hypothetical protein
MVGLTFRIKQFTHSQIYSFTFYDDCHVLAGLLSPVTETDKASPAVEVWMFADSKGRPLNSEGISRPFYRLGGLELPRLRSTSRYTCVKFSENSLSARRSFPSPVPFHVSEDGRLFVINIELTDDSELDYTAVLCIPRHTIQNQISRMMRTVHGSKGGLNIPWASWGPEGCRLFFGEERASKWTRNPYGSLLVTSRYDNTSMNLGDALKRAKVVVTLRDFSPSVISSHHEDQQPVLGTTPSWLRNCLGSWTRYEELEDEDATSHIDHDSVNISGLFLDDVTTRLPYHCASRA